MYNVNRVFDNPFYHTKYRENILKKPFGFFSKSLLGHFGCVNAIEFSKNYSGQLLASGGDDRRILLWKLDESLEDSNKSYALSTFHNSNIFCLAFDSQTFSLLSAGNDDQVIHHDLIKDTVKNVFLYDDAIYGLHMDPFSDFLFCVACEDGQILLTDIRAEKDSIRIASYQSPFHSVQYHPVENNILLTANTREGIGLWDIRKPGSSLYKCRTASPINWNYGKSLFGYSSICANEAVGNAMCARFNGDGSLVLGLSRRLGPRLLKCDIKVGSDTTPLIPICTFDHDTYYNSCTMKSACFAGHSNQFVVSGSDDFNVYVWKIPDRILSDNNQLPSSDMVSQTPHFILEGHKSIVNQTRYEPNRCVLVSSGVEKVIKLWSPFPIGLKKDKIVERDSLENIENVSCSITNSEHSSLDISSIDNSMREESRRDFLLNRAVQDIGVEREDVQEDTGMLAFFDSLLQHELESWESDNSSLSSISQHNDDDSDFDECISFLTETSPPLSSPSVSHPVNTANNINSNNNNVIGGQKRKKKNLSNFNSNTLTAHKSLKNDILTTTTSSSSHQNTCDDGHNAGKNKLVSASKTGGKCTSLLSILPEPQNSCFGKSGKKLRSQPSNTQTQPTATSSSFNNLLISFYKSHYEHFQPINITVKNDKKFNSQNTNTLNDMHSIKSNHNSKDFKRKSFNSYLYETSKTTPSTKSKADCLILNSKCDLINSDETCCDISPHPVSNNRKTRLESMIVEKKAYDRWKHKFIYEWPKQTPESRMDDKHKRYFNNIPTFKKRKYVAQQNETATKDYLVKAIPNRHLTFELQKQGSRSKYLKTDDKITSIQEPINLEPDSKKIPDNYFDQQNSDSENESI